MNPFTETYRQKSNAELQRIIENASVFQPQAVDAAKEELIRRRNEGILDQFEKSQETSDTQTPEELLAEATRKWAENTGLVRPKPVNSQEGWITALAILFGLDFLYAVYLRIFILRRFLHGEISAAALTDVLHLLLIFALPAGIYLFWKRRSAGWVMLTAYAVYAMTGSLLILVLSFSRHFPGVVPVNLVSVILFGAATWVLCRKPMRSLYSVREQGMLITICLTVIAALVLMYPLIRTIIALH